MPRSMVDQFDVSFRNNWDKPVHRWYRFHVGCSSEFPEKMIQTLAVKKHETILDPFCGSGTTLVCAKKNGIDTLGFDVNPFYVFMSTVKTRWDFNLEALYGRIEHIEEMVKGDTETNVSASCSMEIDNIPKYIWRYFEPEVLKQLSIIKRTILEESNEHVRQFLLLALASILVEVSKVHHVGETIVYNKNQSQRIAVGEVLIRKIRTMCSDLEATSRINNPGNTLVDQVNIRDFDESAEDASLDHVITHPPYLNNYNYLLHDRLPLYFLDYFRTPSDEREMRNSILGSVTKAKVTKDFVPVTKRIEKISQEIEKTGDIKRYKAVLEYFDTMNNFIQTLFEKMKDNGCCAMLLGNSYVRGIMIPLDVLIADIARKIGFNVVGLSKVRDRGDGAFQHLYNGKLYESIVLLKRR